MWRFPSAKGPSCKPFVPCGPDVLGRHVGFHPSFIDEDQLARIRAQPWRRFHCSQRSRSPDTGVSFLPVMLQDIRKRQIEAALAATPRPPSKSCSPASVTAGHALVRSRFQDRCPASFGARRAPIRLGLTDPVSERHRAYSFAL